MPIDESPKARPSRPATPPRRKPTSSKPAPKAQPSPTRPLTPGREHIKIAELVLRAVKSKAAQYGVELDIGEFPTYDDFMDEAERDPQRPVRLTSRAVARTADRVGFLRKVSRHLEGTETRSGLASDLVATLYELYERNGDEFQRLFTTYYQHALQQRADKPKLSRAERKAQKAAQKQQTQQGGNIQHETR